MNEESQEKKQREEQYKALVDFFKEDSQIKNTLMSIAPAPVLRIRLFW